MQQRARFGDIKSEIDALVAADREATIVCDRWQRGDRAGVIVQLISINGV